MNEKKSKGRLVLEIVSWVVTGILALLVAANLYTIFAKKITGKQMPTVFGYANVVVVTGSMVGDREDSINVDDMVIVHRQSDYEVGDVVSYVKDGMKDSITHRIIEKKGDVFKTKGDANNTADPEINKDQIVGKVVKIIPGVGKFLQFIQSPIGLLIMIVIAVVLIEWQSIYEGIKKLFNKKEA